MKAKFFHENPDAPTPMGRFGVGAIALIERDGELLMELRSDCERWGLAGGSVEAHESVEDALRREVFEETGLFVTECELFGVFTDPTRIVAYPDGNVVRLISFVYRMEVEDFEPLRVSEESLDFRFFDKHSLRKLDIVETARPIIEAYVSSASRSSIVVE
ncbi:MAG: NUDIX domain-containing protein [Actinomycetota bacterium]|jgi:8-oxo-dGTP pyrophosphatase MutT (NUDIX family)|nr:NUDIX domain-containing protein [Rubrobacter sp.]MDQ3508425.1 NUDIX domain-containing protein [Actinomycetota bacterium]